MAYSEFSLSKVEQAFSLIITDRTDLFAEISEITPSDRLQTFLREYAPFGLKGRTEKARSEFVIAPLLAEVCRLMEDRVSLFSGVEFNVDSEKGLKGACDFIISLSLNAYELTAPALMIVEAKKDDIPGGYGQCVAEMVAARIFNERAGKTPATIHGAVTTGHNWQFLKLEGSTIFIDSIEYHISQTGKILGILLHILQDDQAAQAKAA